MALHQDFKDLLEAFATERVRYLLIGGYAVAFHSRPRFTKDIDLWIDPVPDNVECTARALEQFGAPPDVVQAWRSAGADEIVYLGRPPVRIDLLRAVSGADFAEAYARRATGEWDSVSVSVIGLDDLIAAKRAAGRPQDLLDIKMLERAPRR
jgi:hypothetical protein